MPLMSMPRIAPATALRLVGEPASFDAAGLAPAADEHLGLDHDRRRAAGEEPLCGRARLGDGVGDLPAGTGRPWATSSDLASASWIFTRRTGSGSGGSWAGARWYRARDRTGRLAESERTGHRRLAILIERGQTGRATAEGRDAARPRGASADEGDHDAFAELAGAAISRLDARRLAHPPGSRPGQGRRPERARPGLA